MYENEYFAKEENVWYSGGGFGETLLFLHGYLSVKESFYYQKKFFEKRYNVIIPDLPGFKENTKLTFPFSLDDYAEWIENMLVYYGIKEVSVVAHSFGARVLFKLIDRGKIKIKAVVLVGSAGIKPRFNLAVKIGIARYKLRKKLRLSVDGFGSDDYKRLDDVTKKSFVKIVNERLEENIKKTDVPTLIFCGKKDKETPPYMQKKLHKLIKHGELVKVDGGHFYFCEKPDEFNRLTNIFLKEALK